MMKMKRKQRYLLEISKEHDTNVARLDTRKLTVKNIKKMIYQEQDAISTIGQMRNVRIVEKWGTYQISVGLNMAGQRMQILALITGSIQILF